MACILISKYFNLKLKSDYYFVLSTVSIVKLNLKFRFDKIRTKQFENIKILTTSHE